jgi:hypothetical protein
MKREDSQTSKTLIPMFMTAFQFFRGQILGNPGSGYTFGHAKTNVPLKGTASNAFGWFACGG